MADQEKIQNVIESLTAKFQIAQEEVVNAIDLLVEGKSHAEALAILNELDATAIMMSKTARIKSSYTAGNIETLLSKEQFAEISEETLQTLLIQSEQYLTGEISAMANTVKQEMVRGIINNKTTEEIINSINKKGYGAGIGMKRVVTDGLNNYSRSVTRMMMEEAPDETEYIYIGPADEKTRAFCLSAIQVGAVTKTQIESMGGDFSASLTDGGGINCRHGWEPMSRDVRGQFYRKEEAEELINA